MITLFDEPPRVTLNLELYPTMTEHPVGLLLGLAYDGPGKTTGSRFVHGVVCLASGEVVVLPASAWTINWRYDLENDRFIDLDVAKEEQGT